MITYRGTTNKAKKHVLLETQQTEDNGTQYTILSKGCLTKLYATKPLFKNETRKFPCGPVSGTQHFHSQGPGSTPGWGTVRPDNNYSGHRKINTFSMLDKKDD